MKYISKKRIIILAATIYLVPAPCQASQKALCISSVQASRWKHQCAWMEEGAGLEAQTSRGVLWG